MEKVDVIVFVAKCESGEYETYKPDSAAAGLDFLTNTDIPLSESRLFGCYKWYLDRVAKRFVLMFDSRKEPEKPYNDLALVGVKKEFAEVKSAIEAVIKDVVKNVNEAAIEKHNELKQVEFSGEVVFLRHFGGGGARDIIYAAELRLQRWAKNWEGFEKWSFFLLSSLRPDLFDVDECLIPTGACLTKFVRDLKSGVYNGRRLQDQCCADILRKWKDDHYETEGKVVLFIGIEFDELANAGMSDFLKALPDDKDFNGATSFLFVITQNGVRYSNWWGWNGETSLVQVLQNLRQSGEASGNVFVCYMDDDQLAGFAQVAFKELSGDGQCQIMKIDEIGSLAAKYDSSDNRSQTEKKDLDEKVTGAVHFLETGQTIDPADAEADACQEGYNQVMKELGH